MWFSCSGSGWPWSQAVHLAAPPTKEEHIFLGNSYDFYPDYRKGLHPPAPVYQTNQPASQSMYYFQSNTTSPAGYYVNGVYHGATAPTLPLAGWPYPSSSSYYYSPTSSYSPSTYYNALSNYTCNNLYKYSPYYTAPATPFMFPSAAPAAPYPWFGGASAASPWYGQTGAAQAAMAVAANAALAAAPTSPYYFVGSSAAEIQAQNAIIAAQFGAPKAPPDQLVPYKPGSTPQFWCKEIDGSWTLRELTDFSDGSLASGRWELHPTSGYRYFVRTPI